MKRITAMLTAVVLTLFSPVFAQSLDLAVQIAEAEAARTELIGELMEFEADEAEVFWPVYRAYRGEMVEVLQASAKLIEEAIDRYSYDFSDARAGDMMDEWLLGQRKAAKIKTKYAKRFRKVLTDGQVLRVMQIDNKLNAAMAFNVANAVPLVR